MGENSDDESYEYYDEDEEYSGSEYEEEYEEEEEEYYEEEEEEIDYTQQQQPSSKGLSYDQFNYNNITNMKKATTPNNYAVSESHDDIAKDLEKLNITTPPVSNTMIENNYNPMQFNDYNNNDDVMVNDNNAIIRTEEYNYDDDSMNNDNKKEQGYANEKMSNNFNATATTIDLLKDDLNYIEEQEQDKELVVVSSNESI